MKNKLNVINSQLNDIGKKFDYRKKESLFDKFKSFFDNVAFTLVDSSMGWSKWKSNCETLYVGTASFDGGCWLHAVQHKSKANNQYNNYVNAIAYWDRLNENGKNFFLEFYKEEIFTLKCNLNFKISNLQSQIKYLRKQLLDIDTEIDNLKAINQVG